MDAALSQVSPIIMIRAYNGGPPQASRRRATTRPVLMLCTCVQLARRKRVPLPERIPPRPLRPRIDDREGKMLASASSGYSSVNYDYKFLGGAPRSGLNRDFVERMTCNVGAHLSLHLDPLYLVSQPNLAYVASSGIDYWNDKYVEEA